MIVNYEEARVKLTNTQLKRLNSAENSKTETTLRILIQTFKIKNCLLNYF